MFFHVFVCEQPAVLVFVGFCWFLLQLYHNFFKEHSLENNQEFLMNSIKYYSFNCKITRRTSYTLHLCSILFFEKIFNFN